MPPISNRRANGMKSTPRHTVSHEKTRDVEQNAKFAQKSNVTRRWACHIRCDILSQSVEAIWHSDAFNQRRPAGETRCRHWSFLGFPPPEALLRRGLDFNTIVGEFTGRDFSYHKPVLNGVPRRSLIPVAVPFGTSNRDQRLVAHEMPALSCIKLVLDALCILFIPQDYD